MYFKTYLSLKETYNSLTHKETRILIGFILTYTIKNSYLLIEGPLI